MHNTLHIIILTLCAAAASLLAAVSEFRLDQNRLWLTVQDLPLAQLLEYFADADIDVQIDPAAKKIITGSFNDADMEQALDKLLSPYSYLLDWQRESGPLGERIRLTGIRVFRDGYASAVQPLRNIRRIETSFDGRSRFLTREILIGFKSAASAETLRAFLARTGGTVIAVNAELGIYRILLPEGTNILDLVAQLGNEPLIASAEPNYMYDIPSMKTPVRRIASNAATWAPPSGDKPLAVAILDTGLTSDAQLGKAVIGSFDATNPDTPLTADAVGHGTLMAQIAAGLLDPYNAPVGEGVHIVAIKAFADDGSADAFTLMNAMTYAVKQGTGPISLSWGSETPSRFIETTVQYAMNNGRPVYAAVGNENTGRPMYPAAYPGVVGVAASDGHKLADYSNRGDFVDIIAPGSAGGAKGTSVATAYVAHIDALYRQIHPKATANETSAAIIKAAGPDRILTEDAVKRLLAR